MWRVQINLTQKIDTITPSAIIIFYYCTGMYIKRYMKNGDDNSNNNIICKIIWAEGVVVEISMAVVARHDTGCSEFNLKANIISYNTLRNGFFQSPKHKNYVNNVQNLWEQYYSTIKRADMTGLKLKKYLLFNTLSTRTYKLDR